MKTGTCYFPTYGAAMRYYRPYVVSDKHPGIRDDGVRTLVAQKLNAAEIHIGKPALRPGQTLTIEDNRYHITEGVK